jgi:uncharacterized protein (TIGR02145 family)
MNVDSKWLHTHASSVVVHPHRGICPEGWHIPDSTEWVNLGETVAATSLQAMGFGPWSSATDASGFSALPTTITGGSYGDAQFWSSNEDKNGFAGRWRLTKNISEFYINTWSHSKFDYVPVRCIENYPVEP